MSGLKANKLSLKWSKTKYVFFDKSSKVDYIPLKLPDLKINNSTIKREICHQIPRKNFRWEPNFGGNTLILQTVRYEKLLDFFTKKNFYSLKNYFKGIYFLFVSKLHQLCQHSMG